MEPFKDSYGRYILNDDRFTAEDLAELKEADEAEAREDEIKKIAAESDNVTYVDFKKQ